MKCLFLPLYLALLTTLLQPPVAVQAQAGTVIKTFSLNAKKLLLDPVRPQLYATLPTENSVAVINTDTNAVVATLPTGSIPADLAISPDGTRLYVANTGSTSAGVSVVDLTTLTVLPSLATPFTPGAVAAGLDNRIYVLLGGSEVFGVSGIAQIDVTSGAAANPFPTQYSYQNGSLAMSPNHSILYVGNGGILSFDVSTATPAVLQQNEVGGFGDIIISHDGQYLFAPGSEANSSPDDVSSLISTVNLNAIPRTIASGYYPGPAAFSADGAEIYQAQYLGANPRSSLNVFSTATSALLNSFTLLTPSDYAGNPATATSVAVTSPNGYLYVASSTDPYGDNPTSLRLISTQAAPFFNGSVALSDGFYYLLFPDGNLFGYYNLNTSPYLFHSDLGFEYPIDAADGSGGIYLYDFTSQTFFYTSATLFPYLYDFTLNSFLYYYPNTRIAGHYTAYPRYFYDFNAGQIITK